MICLLCFSNCTELEFLKVNFNTEKVKDMQYMFNNCSKLTSLDITSFNTGICENFENIFDNDIKLFLTIDSRISPSLVEHIPEYVNVTDINKKNNYEEFYDF